MLVSISFCACVISRDFLSFHAPRFEEKCELEKVSNLLLVERGVKWLFVFKTIFNCYTLYDTRFSFLPHDLSQTFLPFPSHS